MSTKKMPAVGASTRAGKKHQQENHKEKTLRSQVSFHADESRLVLPDAAPVVKTQNAVLSPIKGVAPPTNRGVVTNRQNPLTQGSLFNISCDYLTVTTTSKLSDWFRSKTSFLEEFGKQLGFGSVQKRTCQGGFCSRRIQPQGESKRFGKEYESWVLSGGSADSDYYWREIMQNNFEYLGYSTRIDIAFDFHCPEDFYPAQFIDLHRSTINSKGLTVNTAGGEIVGTRYVGSRQSGRFLRVYRKDLEDNYTAKNHGSVLRIELECKQDHARSLWEICVDQKKGYNHSIEVCAFWIQEMTGFLPINVTLEDFEPPTIPKNNTAAIDRLYQFLRQYGIVLDHMFNLGVDIEGLAATRANNSSRMSNTRKKQLSAELDGFSADEINDILHEMLLS